MNITLEQISKLRARTGAGIMDCKTALQESKGDEEKAIDVLRKKGAAKAAKRAQRETSNGIAISKAEKGHGVAIELRCETDFAANSEDFKAAAQELLNMSFNLGKEKSQEQAKKLLDE